MIQELLFQAIKHERMQKKLNELNAHFYNRKHETQIRDELVVIINQMNSVIAISEHPKLRIGAVDLSIYNPTRQGNEESDCIATIELKHHYPRDLLLEQVQRGILSDLSRKVVSPTSHFIHVIQQRTVLPCPLIGKVKFLERNADDISFYVETLENLPSFPPSFQKKTVCIDVPGIVRSTYTFNIYALPVKQTSSLEMKRSTNSMSEQI
ncbi:MULTISPECIES: hypothetical protein [unclassified Citrobacter]|uniref:hypothetical protein n=1 Tax=unclassified Citrobacter TaxID=2644389 RepID=UPI002303786A|nr:MULTISPECIES: hypothetical protein [unclassified Citrobacter]MDA8500493.1 hypothetical protein [Citrobacter sp. Igbk 17]MDA8511566.1 hypothetical protein [Citrobacter sp. Igbk 14]